MWTSLPMLLAAVAAEQAPTVSDYAVSFGIFTVVAIAPHFITGKILGGEKANLLKVLIALFFQIIVGLIVWVVLAGVALFFGASQNMALAFSGIVTLALLSFVMAGIYGYGIAKGALYNVLTTVAMTGILKVLIASFELLPLKKVLAAAVVKMAETAGKRVVENSPLRRAQNAAAKPAVTFATVAEAQAAAVKKYPALGVAGSPFNRRFLELHIQMKSQQPAKLLTTSWPMEIADRVAVDPGME